MEICLQICKGEPKLVSEGDLWGLHMLPWSLFQDEIRQTLAVDSKTSGEGGTRARWHVGKTSAVKRQGDVPRGEIHSYKYPPSTLTTWYEPIS